MIDGTVITSEDLKSVKRTFTTMLVDNGFITAESLSDLKKLENVKLVELNGKVMKESMGEGSELLSQIV